MPQSVVLGQCRILRERENGEIGVYIHVVQAPNLVGYGIQALFKLNFKH